MMEQEAYQLIGSHICYMMHQESAGRGLVKNKHKKATKYNGLSKYDTYIWQLFWQHIITAMTNHIIHNDGQYSYNQDKNSRQCKIILFYKV